MHIAVSDRLDQHAGMQHVGTGLDIVEVLGERLPVGKAGLEGMKQACIRNLACPPAKERDLRNLLHLVQIPSGFHYPSEFKHRPLAHSVAQPVRTAVHQYRGHQAVGPVVIVAQAPQRRLHAAYHHRYLRPEALEYLRIDCNGPVRALSEASVWRIGIVVAEPARGRVMVDHRVHGAGVHREIQPRLPELAEVTQVVPPVGLRNHGHTVAVLLQVTGYACSTEARMIHKGVSGKDDDVDVVPAELLHLLYGSGYVTFCQEVQFRVSSLPCGARKRAWRSARASWKAGLHPARAVCWYRDSTG